MAKTDLKALMQSWLETKHPGERYQWGDARNCACGQFAKDKGLFEEWIKHPSLEKGVARAKQWFDLDKIAMDSDAWDYGRADHTFGGMLKRIKETA